MVDHDILLGRLETSYGLKCLPLSWFRSYLSERSQMIITNNSRTQRVHAKLGVPQDSVLGPLLFILYMADISSLLATCGAAGHLFADDVQAFVHGPPLLVARFSLSLIVSAPGCRQIDLTSMLLKLYLSGLVSLSSFRSSISLSSLNSSHSSLSLQVSGTLVLPLIPHLPLLSTSLIPHAILFSFKVSKGHSSFRVLLYFCHFHSYFICSRIDHCNSFLIGLPKVCLSPIQLVLNTAARLIACFHPLLSHFYIYT